jgi:hypothetical protein
MGCKKWVAKTGEGIIISLPAPSNPLKGEPVPRNHYKLRMFKIASVFSFKQTGK